MTAVGLSMYNVTLMLITYLSSSSPMGHKESLTLMLYGNCCLFVLMQGVIHVKLYHRKRKEF
jgi:hypothetical protein